MTWFTRLIALRSSHEEGIIFTEIQPFGTAGTEGARDIWRPWGLRSGVVGGSASSSLILGRSGAPLPASAAARRLPMDLPRPGLLAAAAAAALSFEGSSSDDAAWRAPSGENAVSKNGERGPEGFALWTRAAIVLKGESWERAPGVLLGERSPLDFFAAGLVGGDVGSSMRAAITAASNGVLDSAESLSEVDLAAAGAGAAASLVSGSVLDMVVAWEILVDIRSRDG
jgi:hypothetical protein